MARPGPRSGIRNLSVEPISFLEVGRCSAPSSLSSSRTFTTGLLHMFPDRDPLFLRSTSSAQNDARRTTKSKASGAREGIVTVASPFESFINRPALWPISSQNQLAKGSRGSPCPFGISAFDLKNNSHARSARTDRSLTWSSSTIFMFINTSSQEVFKITWDQLLPTQGRVPEPLLALRRLEFPDQRMVTS